MVSVSIAALSPLVEAASVLFPEKFCFVFFFSPSVAWAELIVGSAFGLHTWEMINTRVSLTGLY